MKFFFSFVLFSVLASGAFAQEDKSQPTAAGQVDTECAQTAEADRSVNPKSQEAREKTQIAQGQTAVKG